MQGDTLIENKNAGTLSTKQKRIKSLANNGSSKLKHYAQPDTLKNDVPIENSKQSYNMRKNEKRGKVLIAKDSLSPSKTRKNTTLVYTAQTIGNIPNSKRKQKNKVTLLHSPKQQNARAENVFAEGIQLRKTCKEGVCSAAAKNKELSFICKCKVRKKASCACTDVTSDETKTIESNTTIRKLRHKMASLYQVFCKKYSQKMNEQRQNERCKTRSCKAFENQKELFKCFCKKIMFNTCTIETCNLGKENIHSKMKERLRNQESQQSVKTMRQPLDTTKALGVVNPTPLKARSSKKENIENVQLKEQHTKHHIKVKAPVKVSTSTCGDMSCHKHRSSSTCSVCCKCKKVGVISKCRKIICKSFKKFKRKRKSKKLDAVNKRKKDKSNNDKKALKDSMKQTKKITQQPLKKSKKSKKSEIKSKEKTKKKAKEKTEKKAKEKTEKKAKEKTEKKAKIEAKKKAEKIIKKKKKKVKPKFDEKEAAKKKKEAARKKKQMANDKIRENQSLKEDERVNKRLRREEEVENKKQEKLRKKHMKELERLNEGKEEMHETSCLADFFLGIANIAYDILKTLAFVIFNFIMKPKISFRYVKARIKNPLGTYERIKRWVIETWYVKKLQMTKTLAGSHTMSIMDDTFRNSALFQAFSDKGKTKKERQQVELEKKKRKQRIINRDQMAIRSCKHNLLSTLRKTPCMWVYHVCPHFYPQCLSLLAFWRKFSNLMLFCVAFAFWTPCILLCELCRGLMCCTMCMG